MSGPQHSSDLKHFLCECNDSTSPKHIVLITIGHGFEVVSTFTTEIWYW